MLGNHLSARIPCSNVHGPRERQPIRGENQMHKNPEQTARTKQSLSDAYWELALKQGMWNVTIGQITKKAQLNRGTFYVYYIDIEDLIEQEEMKIISDIRGQLQEVLSSGIPDDFHVLSNIIMENLAKYDERFFLIIGKNGDPNFIYKAREEVLGIFENIFKSSSQQNELIKYIIAFSTSAAMGLLNYWQESGRNIPFERLSDIAGHAVMGIMGRLNEPF